MGFDLSQRFLDGSFNFDFRKHNFELVVRQTKDKEKDETLTTFDISFKRMNLTVSGTLTHILKNEECVTVITKSNAVEHKCYGGTAEGLINIDSVFHR